MENLVISEFKLGIIAGGQLGKMLVLAASNWHINTFILDKEENCPASAGCNVFVKGDPLNYDDVLRFGEMVDMVTIEIENVNTNALKELKRRGVKVLPDPEIVELIQDKGLQKNFYRENDIPTSNFFEFDNSKEVFEKINSAELSFPFVQKLKKGGYDGKGVLVAKNENDLSNLFDAPSIIEEHVKIKKEISIIAARNLKGEVKCFPAVEMEFNQKANLVEKLICPASLDSSIALKAEKIAADLMNSLNMVGILAVEMFIDEQGNLLVNESAPRPHNSGHHTIESVITSQYEQLLRAIFNFSLGSTKIKIPAVMINILGDPFYNGKPKYIGLTDCMKIEGVKYHIYGKNETRPFRKMGHATVISKTIEEAKEKADKVLKTIKVIA